LGYSLVGIFPGWGISSLGYSLVGVFPGGDIPWLGYFLAGVFLDSLDMFDVYSSV